MQVEDTGTSSPPRTAPNLPKRPPARHVDGSAGNIDLRQPRLQPRPRPAPATVPSAATSVGISIHGSSRGPSTSQYSLMALTLQRRRPGYAFPRRIMHDIEGRTGSEANATLLPCASNATGHFPACCSSCHLRRCHSSRLISSHLVSFDSLLFHSAHIYTQCLSTRSLPASFHSQGRPGSPTPLHSTAPWVIYAEATTPYRNDPHACSPCWLPACWPYLCPKSHHSTAGVANM